MIALEIRKLIIKNREDGVPVSEISRITSLCEATTGFYEHICQTNAKFPEWESDTDLFCRYTHGSW